MTWKPLPSSDPPPVKGVSSSLQRIGKRLGIAPPSLSDRIFSEWPELAGDQLAGKCVPISLVDGVLQVEVADSRWATQLKWLSPQLIVKANQLVGDDVVKRVEVRISGFKPRK